MTAPASSPAAASLGVVLSLFPGADLLGRGFALEGYCVVCAQDAILGGDIREFGGRIGIAEGIVGGPPCQEFSRANREEPSGYGLAMLDQYCRVVAECQPEWWLMENVPTVPDVAVDGYYVTRFDLRADECGLAQSRLRHFQWGSRHSWERLVIPRCARPATGSQRTAMASEGRRTTRRSYADFCALQGTPPIEHEWLTKAGRYGVVGNGVPVPMARVIAHAIATRSSVTGHLVATCACGCGRVVTGRRTLATAACRKRMERRRAVPHQAAASGAESPSLSFH